MEFLVTFTILGVCMAIMAVGLVFKRKPLVKDCGLDPTTGERVTDCACANQGKPQCLKRKVFNLFGAEPNDCSVDRAESPKIVSLSPRDR